MVSQDGNQWTPRSNKNGKRWVCVQIGGWLENLLNKYNPLIPICLVSSLVLLAREHVFKSPFSVSGGSVSQGIAIKLAFSSGSVSVARAPRQGRIN